MSLRDAAGNEAICGRCQYKWDSLNPQKHYTYRFGAPSVSNSSESGLLFAGVGFFAGCVGNRLRPIFQLQHFEDFLHVVLNGAFT